MEIRPTMKVNLMQPEMGTSISTPQISSDGYEITNLLSNSSSGFLVEHFIKPPIFIEIDFVCNIFVHEIIINTRVGTQKSKGIEILVNDSTVGKCYLNSQEDVVQWVRNANVDKIKDCTRNDKVSKCSFFNGAHKHLNSTKRITIKVFKTENSSLVSVKSLKIFGSINKRTNTVQDIQKYVDLLHIMHTRPVANLNIFPEGNLSTGKYKNVDSEKNPKNNSAAENISTPDYIPEDFIDPITHEFMTNPLILPSGKIIDKSTLDKYLEIELKWNRLPNDPFTHVKFSQHQKPVQALQLKSRIDKFILLNSNNSTVDKFPRTFQNAHSKSGRENLLFKMLENKVLCSSSPVKNNFVDKSKRENIQNKTEKKTGSPELKRRKLCSNAHLKINSSTSSTFQNQTMKEKDPSNESNNFLIDSEEKFQDVIDLTEHVDKGNAGLKEEDLEKQIQDTLKNLPSFIVDSSNESNKQNDSITNKGCFKCNQDCLLYKLIKCSHYICRPCLVTSKEGICTFCNVGFSSCDVIRIFKS